MENQVDVVGEIKRKVRLSSFAKRYAKHLKQEPGSRGKYRSECFIHGGDNPASLSVDDLNGFYKCFACGEGGDIFNMWMSINGNTDFRAALEALALEAGVELPKNEKIIPKARLYEVQDIIASECMDFLLHSEDEDAEAAREYLEDRGVTKKMIRTWSLGFMPEGDYSMEFIDEVTHDTWALSESGLVRGEGKRRWTPFQGRLMMPIIDVQDRVVGFTARIIPNIECYKELAKYMNTSETSVYHKSEVLYGEHLLGPVDRKQKGPDFERIVISEGPFDAIATNSVLGDDSVALAACGTSVTLSHLPQLRRGKKITHMFDGDEAGRKAAIRSMWMTNHLPDTNISAIILEDNGEKLDPWDLCIENPNLLETKIVDALPYIYSVVEAQWSLIGESRTDMLEWVRQQYSSMTILRHRESLVTQSAKAMGMSKTALKGELSLPVMLADHRYDTTEKSAEENLASDGSVKKSLSLQTSSTVSMLLSLPYEKMISVLASLEIWSDTSLDALESWGTIYNPEDTKAYERLIFGMDANVSRDLEQEIAGLQIDCTTTTQNIQTILSGMAQQLLTGIDSLISQGYSIGILGEHAITLRNMVNKGLMQGVYAQPYLFSYMLDCAMDIERITVRQDNREHAAS